jgi:hypothetical protein
MTATATNAGSVAERDWTIYVGGRPLPALVAVAVMGVPVLR